jgi:hypothetical protein
MFHGRLSTFSSFYIAHMEYIYRLMLIIIFVAVVAVAIVVKISFPCQTLNSFSLTLYFFINNKDNKRYIHTLNLYSYRIPFYDIVSIELSILNDIPANILHTTGSVHFIKITGRNIRVLHRPTLM